MTERLSLLFTPRARRAAALLISIAAVSVGCTLITSRQNGQCLSDAQCKARGGMFAQTRCSAQGICELITLPEAGVDGGLACTKNLDCAVQLGGKARCVNSQCQLITNDQCTAVDGDSNDDNAIFIGVMTPRTGFNEPFGIGQYGVVTTAASDWKSGASGQTGAHNFVTIGCDELVDPVGVANFLINTVQVRAILGPIYDDDFEKVVPVTAANNTFLLGARADDVKLPSLAGIGQNAWSCMPNRSIQVALFPSLMSSIETSIKITHPSDIKVFFAVAADTGTTNFGNAVEQVLSFNGKGAIANGSNYVRQSVPFDFVNEASYTTTVAAMIAAAPDLVIIAQEYDTAKLVGAMNDSWPGTSPPLPRILMLVEDPQVEQNFTSPEHNRFAGKLDFLKWDRSAAETANALTFAASYRSVAQQDPAPESERMYDCFFENAYALQTAIDQGVTPDGVATTTYASAIIALNAPGTLYNVGPTDVPPMLTLLGAKGDPDLDGASGPLEMNAAHGSPVQNVDLDCIQGDGGVTPSGVQYNGADGGATGSYSCL